MKRVTKARASAKRLMFFLIVMVFPNAGALVSQTVAGGLTYRDIETRPPGTYSHSDQLCTPTLGELWLPPASSSESTPGPLLAYHEGKLSAVVYEIPQEDMLRHKEWEGLEIFSVSGAGVGFTAGESILIDHVDIVDSTTFAGAVLRYRGKRFYQVRIFFLTHQEHDQIRCGKRQQPPLR